MTRRSPLLAGTAGTRPAPARRPAGHPAPLTCGGTPSAHSGHPGPALSSSGSSAASRPGQSPPPPPPPPSFSSWPPRRVTAGQRPPRRCRGLRWLRSRLRRPCLGGSGSVAARQPPPPLLRRAAQWLRRRGQRPAPAILGARPGGAGTP